MIIRKWPLHPKPSHHQLLYSWIEDLAKEYEVSYQRFCKNVLSLTPEEIGDLRTTLPEKALSILSKGTALPLDDLSKRDLPTTFKMLSEEIAQRMKTHPEEFVWFLEKNVHK